MASANICIITGTRAEFGIWRPVLRAIQESKKLRLQLLVTGMHLQRQFGHTIDDITAEGLAIVAKVPMYLRGDNSAQSLARATLGMAKAFQVLKPDLVMVLGDRLEILAAANAALASQIPLAHLHGGETAPAQWDEQIRHAVTKIAHLHFPATKKSAQRIRQMGEPPNSIHTVGAPALDMAIAAVRETGHVLEQIRLVAGVNPLLLLHPSSPNDSLEYRRTKMLIEILHDPDDPRHLDALGPNNDPGHRGILRAYREHSNQVRLQMSLSQGQYWLKLVSSGLLVGNSSSGILEAASFGIPVINLGDRQAGRQRNANVIDVPWENLGTSLPNAVQRAISDKAFQAKIARRKNLYGDGRAAHRIVRILESLKFPLPTIKRFHDQSFRR